MGIRLLKTWQAVHPDSLLEKVLALSQPDTRGTRFGPTLPTAFAAACMSTSSWNEPLDLRRALSGYTYTRLAATVSAAMRLMPIGQTEAHQLLGRTLARASSTIDDVLAGRVEAESFTPALDVAQMAQVHLPSRLFRS
jgi:urease accessory protein